MWEWSSASHQFALSSKNITAPAAEADPGSGPGSCTGSCVQMPETLNLIPHASHVLYAHASDHSGRVDCLSAANLLCVHMLRTPAPPQLVTSFRAGDEHFRWKKKN